MCELVARVSEYVVCVNVSVESVLCEYVCVSVSTCERVLYVNVSVCCMCQSECVVFLCESECGCVYVYVSVGCVLSVSVYECVNACVLFVCEFMHLCVNKFGV